MFNIARESVDWNGQKIVLETGKIARQANASVMVKMGGSIVLCTITFNKSLKEDVTFFPLSVHYLEKYYAVGRFPGGFIKREGKLSDRETLISRLIDRSIRPLFSEDFFHEVSVVCTVLSYDDATPTDILAIIGTAAALKISEIPVNVLLAATRVSLIDGQFKFNTPLSILKEAELDLVVTGTDSSILMIESSAKEINNDKLVSAISLAHQNIQPVIKLIDDFSSQCQKEQYSYSKSNILEVYESLNKEFYKEIEAAYSIVARIQRKEVLDNLYQKAYNHHSAKDNFQLNIFNAAYQKLQKKIIKRQIFNNRTRIDGRTIDEVREIRCEIGMLSRTHGSALFTRGETQSLSIVTLGSLQDSQIKDDITGITNEKFMVHYNFPPYSVGEVGMLKPPGRREIGHGKLASKAILPILPNNDQFPYTIRVVSEITESNGSSSMATVCAAILSMMDAGVPIKTAVSGIAMGLILEKDKYMIISDITGDEDALGDMDFKVTSTKNGITALQMDMKVTGITIEIIKEAILQAKQGCNHILNKMCKLISKPKETLNSSAPRMISIKVKKNNIKDIIGPGGKNIKEICEKTNTKIDIANDNNVSIFAPDKKSLDESVNMIQAIIAVPETDHIYKAQVIGVVQFGIFVKFLKNTEGLVHVSEITDRNIIDINKLIHKDMYVNVKYISTDHRGKIKLSMKNIDQPEELKSQDIWKKLMESKPKKRNFFNKNC